MYPDEFDASRIDHYSILELRDYLDWASVSIARVLAAAQAEGVDVRWDELPLLLADEWRMPSWYDSNPYLALLYTTAQGTSAEYPSTVFYLWDERPGDNAVRVINAVVEEVEWNWSRLQDTDPDHDMTSTHVEPMLRANHGQLESAEDGLHSTSANTADDIHDAENANTENLPSHAEAEKALAMIYNDSLDDLEQYEEILALILSHQEHFADLLRRFPISVEAVDS